MIICVYFCVVFRIIIESLSSILRKCLAISLLTPQLSANLLKLVKTSPLLHSLKVPSKSIFLSSWFALKSKSTHHLKRLASCQIQCFCMHLCKQIHPLLIYRIYLKIAPIVSSQGLGELYPVQHLPTFEYCPDKP